MLAALGAGVAIIARRNSVGFPLALLFAGLTSVYVCEFFAGLFWRESEPDEELKAVKTFGGLALGLSRLLTGAWLMYLTCAVTLNTTSGTNLPT